MQLITNEPADSNIRTSVDQFWQALQNVADDAKLIPARSDLRQKALAMSDLIKEDYTKYQDLRVETNQRIIDQVSEINRYADQIADLNNQIGKVTALGDRANDLMDKRDLLVESLAKCVNINHFVDANNRMTVTIKGIPLVDGQIANHILTVPNNNDLGMAQLQWETPAKQPVEVNNGNLMGLLEIRDQEIPQVITDLNNFATTLINQVNALHQTGYGLDESTGRKFFTGTDASSIDLDDPIKDQANGLQRIAASDSLFGLPGNNKIMLAISQLKQAKLFTTNTATMGEFIGAMVDYLGEKTLIADSKSGHQTTLITNLDQRRESVCGVSMDEEITNMVKYQQGFNAAAKIISTMDEMLDVVVNKLKM